MEKKIFFHRALTVSPSFRWCGAATRDDDDDDEIRAGLERRCGLRRTWCLPERLILTNSTRQERSEFNRIS